MITSSNNFDCSNNNGNSNSDSNSNSDISSDDQSTSSSIMNRDIVDSAIESHNTNCNNAGNEEHFNEILPFLSSSIQSHNHHNNTNNEIIINNFNSNYHDDANGNTSTSSNRNEEMIPPHTDTNSSRNLASSLSTNENNNEEMTNSSLSLRCSQISASVASLFTTTTNSKHSRSTTTTATAAAAAAAAAINTNVPQSLSQSQSSKNSDQVHLLSVDSSSLEKSTCSSTNSTCTRSNENSSLRNHTGNGNSIDIDSSSSVTTIVSAATCTQCDNSNCNINPCNSISTTSTTNTATIPICCEGMNISTHEYNSFLTVGRQLVQSSAAMSSSTPSIIQSTYGNDEPNTYEGMQNEEHNFMYNSNPTENNSPSLWYSKIQRDDDLKYYGQIAEEVLSVIQPEGLNFDSLSSPSSPLSNHRQSLTVRNRYVPIVEPPELNKDEIKKYCKEDIKKKMVCEEKTPIISQVLPKEFICPLCNDVLVGSIIVDCGCTSCTFCIPCLENEQRRQSQRLCELNKFDTQITEKEDSDNDYGFVMVYHDQVHSTNNTVVQSQQQCREGNGKSQYKCPQCREPCNNAIPCHNLDVAILNAMRNNDERNKNIDKEKRDTIKFIKSSYYSRLNSWREEYQRRLQSETDIKKQMILSKFISEQEAIMDEVKRRNARENAASRQRFQLNQGEIPLIAAALVGINFFLFRKLSF